jgi:biopolymer transport protein ExbD
MASIDVGGKSGGRKSMDANVPLIPILDLLLCCLMFLLVTAVWNSLAAISISQRLPGEASANQVAEDKLQLLLLVTAQSYELSTTAGDRIVIPARGDGHDLGALAEKLRAYRNAYPSLEQISVSAEDNVAYESLIATLDATRERGFESIVL